MFINSKQNVYYMVTLFSKERDKLIEFVIDNPSKEIEIRELARLLKLSPAHVSRTLKNFKRYGVIKNKRVDLSNPYVKALKIFFNIKKLVNNNVTRILKKLEPISAGVYGSWANGSNYEDSDLDVWIKVDRRISESRVASVSNDIRKVLGRNVQILVLSMERIDRLKKEDPIFYYSLIFGSIILFGETLE